MSTLLEYLNKRSFSIGALLDPDKTHHVEALKSTADKIDFFLVGGSFVSKLQMDELILSLKSFTNKPIYVFPGDVSQWNENADGLLFLQMLSGRNPEYLIGQHVKAAPHLLNTSLDVIPCSYLLVDGGVMTSVEYISNTKPLPANKADLIVATALAGQFLGHQLCYMDAGSGAQKAIAPEIAQKVAQTLKTPVLVGGGIKSVSQIKAYQKAGVKGVILGSVLEDEPQFLETI